MLLLYGTKEKNNRIKKKEITDENKEWQKSANNQVACETGSETVEPEETLCLLKMAGKVVGGMDNGTEKVPGNWYTGNSNVCKPTGRHSGEGTTGGGWGRQVQEGSSFPSTGGRVGNKQVQPRNCCNVTTTSSAANQRNQGPKTHPI